jgi:signal recognition particle subunit SRP54
MFESLTARLMGVWDRLRGRGVLRPEDVEQALREVRVALLEADVDLGVAKSFLEAVRQRAQGEEVLASLTPAQTVVHIVYEEMAHLLGDTAARLTYGEPPTVWVLVGLQGSGKTTAAAKLAYQALRQGRRPLLVAADLVRPAAAQQLSVLGARLDVPVWTARPGEDAPTLAARAREEASAHMRDTVVVDTAGRLEIDLALMEEAARVVEAVRPVEVLLVLDAMTGQDAVRVARGFAAHLPLTGLVLTKMDGDARGGAALSLRAATGLPIKLVGTGERPEQAEPFHPDRMASRILGMGDVLTLLERSQQALEGEKASEMAPHLAQGTMDLDDFLQALRQVRRMGPLDSLLRLLPGMGALKAVREVSVDEAELRRYEAILSSMTPQERRHPEILDASRRRRVARGSGTQVQEVNRLLRQFEAVSRLMQKMGGVSQRLRRAGGWEGLPRGAWGGLGAAGAAAGAAHAKTGRGKGKKKRR